MPTATLMIQPHTQVRSTQGDAIYFRIPRAELREVGRKRLERLEKYNNYKITLLELAIDQGFTIPSEYFRVMFFIPMPRTWRKWKREANNMRAHQSKPDGDNLYKAFADALLKRDQAIWDFRVTKIWVDHPTGYIQVIWGEDLGSD